MKRYEIREINVRENRRIAIYFADEIEIKKDDYGTFVEDKQIGKKVGFKIEGKNRKTWVHAVRTAIQILDNETGEAMYIKSNIEELEEMGRHDIAEKL